MPSCQGSRCQNVRFSSPTSLIYRKGIKRAGSAPLLLYGYGAYGFALPVVFQAARLSLPAKYVAKPRATKTDRNPLLLKTNMAAGHGGASDRRDALREQAFTLAFVLTQLGVTK